MRLATLGLSIALTLASISASRARADEPETESALHNTQQVLRDPEKRKNAAKADPAAASADATVRATAKNDANTQAIYDLSADVLKTLSDAAGGDPAKMMEILEEAKKNPAKFAERFTPEQRAKLAEIAKQIETTQSAQPATSAPQSGQ